MKEEALASQLFLGPLRSEYLVLPDRHVYYNLLGGPVVYAATGASIWSPHQIALVSRVGKDFPKSFIERLLVKGWNIEGIRILPEKQPFHSFYIVKDWTDFQEAEPLKEFSTLNLPCPPELLDFVSPTAGEAENTYLPDLALRPDDVPPAFDLIQSVYLAPCHLTSQITLTVALRRKGIGTIMLSPSERIMNPQYLQDFRILLQDIEVFFARERSIRNLFRKESRDVFQMSELLSSYGADIVILQRSLDGYAIFDSKAKRHQFIPAYPVKAFNPIGCGDAFCGGFLANWRTSYDPIESALHGSVSASLALEGAGGLFACERNPLLADARLQSLRNLLPRS